MDIESNDSFDKGLIEMIEGTSGGKTQPKQAKAVDAENRDTVEKGKNKMAGKGKENDDAKQDENKLSGMEVLKRSPRKLKPKTKSAAHGVRGDSDSSNQVQSSTVTRSHQVDSGDAVDSSKRKNLQHLPPNSPKGARSSSQDAEGEDTEDCTQQSPRILRRRRRENGPRLQSNKRKSRIIAQELASSSSSGSEVEEMEVEANTGQSSSKAPRYNIKFFMPQKINVAQQIEFLKGVPINQP